MGKELVTGDKGFIGGHLSLALDNPLGLDIKELEDIRYVNDLTGVETIYHLAAVPSVPRSVKFPLLTTTHNVMGTVNLLDVALRSNVSNFIFSSSSSIYGGMIQRVNAIEESRKPNPKSPYAASKMACEHYINAFNDLYPSFNGTILRYFNVFGDGQRADSAYAAVIPKFIDAAIDNKPLTIFGDGEQTRSFTYVKDVVMANILAKGHRGTYNIANKGSVSVNELAEIIKSLTNSKSKIVHLEERKGDVKDSIADISKAKKEFKWKPKYSLEDGLKEMLNLE